MYQAGGGTTLYRPLCSVLYSRQGRLSTVPFVRFYIAEGGDGSLPSPVFGFVAEGEGRLSTVPCVRLYIAEGGDGSIPSPVFGFTKRGVEDSSLPSPVFGFLEHRGERLSTVPCLRFYIGIRWCLGEGTVSDTPPPPVGRSKLNNSTCGVEKKKIGRPWFRRSVYLFLIRFSTCTTIATTLTEIFTNRNKKKHASSVQTPYQDPP